MLNTAEKENLIKANQTANQLIQELQNLTGTSNLLLADIVLEILQKTVQVEQRLSRVSLIAGAE